jgi:hypothetical protein
MASYVATETITVRGEDGKAEQLKAGVTYVHGQHFLTSRYPDLFEPVIKRKRKSDRARSQLAWKI